MKRLVEQTGCQHDYWETCAEYPDLCPGGSSREVTVDYEAGANAAKTECLVDLVPEEAQIIVNAALGGL